MARKTTTNTIKKIEDELQKDSTIVVETAKKTKKTTSKSSSKSKKTKKLDDTVIVEMKEPKAKKTKKTQTDREEIVVVPEAKKTTSKKKNTTKSSTKATTKKKTSLNKEQEKVLNEDGFVEIKTKRKTTRTKKPKEETDTNTSLEMSDHQISTDDVKEYLDNIDTEREENKVENSSIIEQEIIEDIHEPNEIEYESALPKHADLEEFITVDDTEAPELNEMDDQKIIDTYEFNQNELEKIRGEEQPDLNEQNVSDKIDEIIKTYEEDKKEESTIKDEIEVLSLEQTKDLIEEFEQDIQEEKIKKQVQDLLNKQQRRTAKKKRKGKKKYIIDVKSKKDFSMLEDDLRSLYDKVNDIVEDTKEIEILSGDTKEIEILDGDTKEIEVLDGDTKEIEVLTGDTKQLEPIKEEKKGRKLLIDYISQKVLNFFLIFFFVIFLALFIAFIWLVVYVCTF